MSEILVMDSDGYEGFWSGLKTEHKMHFASTAAEGLGMMSEGISIVFLDLMLPDRDGIEVLKLIKNSHPSAAVIVTSSTVTQETCLEAFRNGARDYMKKPLMTDEILHKISLLADARENSPQRRHIYLSAVSLQDELHAEVPCHLLEGLLRVKHHISENYAENLTLKEACKMASLSKTYFCRFFKCVAGHSLRNYHHVVRIQKAEELLLDKTLSVTDVATRLGYDDPNYFSTIYRKITGFSPREWQSSCQYHHAEEKSHPSPDSPESCMTYPDRMTAATEYGESTFIDFRKLKNINMHLEDHRVL